MIDYTELDFSEIHIQSMTRLASEAVLHIRLT